jgi:hypothetical protein
LDEHAVHTVIFEGIPGHDDKLRVGILGSLHDAARSGQALVTHALADSPYMDGFHADLPVCGVEESHGAFNSSRSRERGRRGFY